MMMMMIVDLYSALCRAPLLRYVSRCIVKRNIFGTDRRDLMLSDGSILKVHIKFNVAINNNPK